jgi:lysophospholipase L1-like esterase
LRRLAARLGLACVSGLVGFGLVELGLRAKHGVPLPERLPILEVRANALRGWEMTPSVTHYTYLHPVRVNALGLRGPEVEPKRPGERRILCVGDSLTYGQGVADPDTVPALLESLLTAEDAPVTVVNGGLRAYATHQELGILYELGEAIQPDEVLLFWYWNDLEQRDIQETYDRLVESGPIAFDVGEPFDTWQGLLWRCRQVLRRSATLNLLHERLFPRTGSNWDEAFIERGFERLERYLDHFVTTTEALGASFRVVLVPDAGAFGGGGKSGALTDRARELAESKGIETIDLRPALSEWIAEHGYAPILPYDGHFNAQGNACLAEALAELLERAE